MALAGMVIVAIPLAGASAVRESQGLVNSGELSEALGEAGRADAIQPYSATASLQQALVLEQAGDLDGAVIAARNSTSDEPTNWRTWFVLSRLEAQTGNAEAAVDAYRRARDLNPRSPLFQQ
jgi:tetratricopeptide (TPR) repeat protein